MHKKNMVGSLSFRRKATRLRVWKVLNIVVAITTIINVSAIGSLVGPRKTNAQATNVNTAPTASITVNKWLFNGQIWVQDNTTANNVGFHWMLDSGSPAFVMGDTAQEVTAGEHTVAENSLEDYQPIGYFLDNGNGSCVEPDGQWDHLILDVQPDHSYTVNFCNEFVQHKESQATLKVHKQVDTNHDGQWDATDGAAYDLGFRWGFAGDPIGQAFDSFVTNLPGGDYQIVEGGPTGYHFIGWTYENPAEFNPCDSDKLLDAGTPIGDPITVHITAGESNHITLCNVKDDEPKTGTLIVHKEVDVDGDGNFSGQYDGTDAKGNALGFRWGTADNDINTNFGDSQEVPAGDVSVWENTQPGYSFIGWHYTDGDATVCYKPQRDGDVIQGEDGPFPVNVEVEAGHTTEITLCNQRDTGTIAGYKWNDLNGNGNWDDGEPTLEGWYFQTNDGHGAWSDANGLYQIHNVPTGVTHVVEFNNCNDEPYCKQGWVNTNADNVFMDVTVNKNGTTYLDFGNFKTTSISGSKFNDLDGNGKRNEDEPGVADWQIQLYKFDQYYFDHTGLNDGFLPEGDPILTDGDGHYAFNDLGPGKYRVREVQQGGWTQTTTNPSDIDPLMSGTAVTDVDFGNAQLDGVIQGTKYYDWNRNNITDEGDQPLKDWTIFLDLNDNDQLDGGDLSTTTDSDGHYSFTNLAHGEYDVCEVLPLGWAHSFNPAGISYHATYCHQEVEPDATVDFHNYLTGAIHGYKWNDLNGNGFYDNSDFSLDFCAIMFLVCPSSEPKLPGWTIFLDLNDNSALDLGEPSTVTDDAGNYAFDDLPPGTYTVCEVQQANWNQTFPATGTGCHQVEIPYTIGSESGCTAYYPYDLPIYHSDQFEYIFTPIAQCNFGNEPQPDLTILKTVDHLTADPGNTLTYTITLTNSGPADANGVRVDDVLPLLTGAPFDITPAPTSTPPGHLIWDDLFVAGNGGTLILTFKVVINGELPIGTTTIINTANLSNSPVLETFSVFRDAPLSSTLPELSAVSTPVYAGSSTATTTVTVNPPTIVTPPTPSVLGLKSPNLSITKQADVKVLNPGQPVNYTVVVTSTGEGDASNVVVTDKLPAGFTYAVGGGSTKTWNLGTMAAGSQQVLTFKVNVGKNVKAGNYTNTATVKGNDVDPRSASASVQVKLPLVLGLATTGVSARDYLIFSLGLLLIGLGAVGLGFLRRRSVLENTR